MSLRSVRRSLVRLGATLVLVGAVAVPLPNTGTHAAAAMTQPAFVLGREGGNIRPYSVTIYDDGSVTTSGAVSAPSTRIHLSPDALAGLRKLAQSEGFYAMPTHIVGRGLPDIAGTFIRVTNRAGSREVHLLHARNTGYEQLYAVLLAVAGVSS